MSKVASKLGEIQSTLNAPKNLENKFGNYRYRSAESILEALKPHLELHNAFLTLSDEMVEVGGRIYVKATATFQVDGESVITTAFARETESKKGMDEAQITGAASSYARKYALNGLFCIDDTKDADATNDHGKSAPSGSAPKEDNMVEKIVEALNKQTTLSGLNAKMEKAKGTPHGNDFRVIAAFEQQTKALTK